VGGRKAPTGWAQNAGLPPGGRAVLHVHMYMYYSCSTQYMYVLYSTRRVCVNGLFSAGFVMKDEHGFGFYVE
jgi:hypothetical protein